MIGRTLVEVKTAAASREAIDKWIEQIVRYLLVADRDRFGFEDVVLYLAREGIVIRWPAVELLSKLSGRAVRPSTLQEEYRALAVSAIAARS